MPPSSAPAPVEIFYTEPAPTFLQNFHQNHGRVLLCKVHQTRAQGDQDQEVSKDGSLHGDLPLSPGDPAPAPQARLSEAPTAVSGHCSSRPWAGPGPVRRWGHPSRGRAPKGRESGTNSLASSSLGTPPPRNLRFSLATWIY